MTFVKGNSGGPGRPKHPIEKRKEKIKSTKKAYYLSHRIEILEKNRSWRKNNADYLKDYNSNYCINHRKQNNLRMQRRRATDLKYRLSLIARGRFTSALRNKYKAGSAVKDLGCSIDELKTRLETMFQKGMSWENYGRTGWHIDHIIPLVSFDLSDRKQFLKACNYRNLQPMWAKDNLSKGPRLVYDKRTTKVLENTGSKE